MIIQVDGGLCNRLRASLSYLSLCRKNNEELIVVWHENAKCSATFNELFLPVPQLSVINESNDTLHHPKYVGGSICTTVKKQQYRNTYRELVPIRDIQDSIDSLILKLGRNFIALHVRRTDHIELAKKNGAFTSDKEFIRFIKDHDKINHKDDHSELCKIYLATDNRRTQKFFLRKFPNRIMFNKLIAKSNDLRQTSVLDAVIDLFICKHAKEFKGSGWSSFTDTISLLR